MGTGSEPVDHPNLHRCATRGGARPLLYRGRAGARPARSSTPSKFCKRNAPLVRERREERYLATAPASRRVAQEAAHPAFNRKGPPSSGGAPTRHSGCSSLRRAPALGAGGGWGGASHPDQRYLPVAQPGRARRSGRRRRAVEARQGDQDMEAWGNWQTRPPAKRESAQSPACRFEAGRFRQSWKVNPAGPGRGPENRWCAMSAWASSASRLPPRTLGR